jgi:hypothetical protein
MLLLLLLLGGMGLLEATVNSLPITRDIRDPQDFSGVGNKEYEVASEA